MNRERAFALVLTVLFMQLGCSGVDSGEPPSVAEVGSELDLSDHLQSLALARLGEQLFNDERLSASGRESCASCHEAGKAFTGNANRKAPLFPVSTGAFPELQGVRNTPTAMYRTFAPPFGFLEFGGRFVPVGGQFLDGRADSLTDQAKLPFLNPREMAMPSKRAVVARIEHGPSAELFRFVYGRRAFDDVDTAYDRAAAAIAAFEGTPRFQPFSSKFDAVLRGSARLSAQEQRGFAAFQDPEKGRCIGCHLGQTDSHDPHDWQFTTFSYDNIGVPRNPLIADNADPAYFDLGLCQQAGIESKVPAAAGDPAQVVAHLCGAFKVPTLRNVAITAPYMHNGRFIKLRDVVAFYATRDTNPERWYPTRPDGSVAKFDDLPPEYQGNVNTFESPYDRKPGEAPRLTPREIDDIVAFLQTLTDGYRSGY